MRFTWTEKDSGWDRLATLAKTLRDHKSYVKAGVIGQAAAEKRLTEDELHRQNATLRDENGRFLKGSGKKSTEKIQGSGPDNSMLAAIHEFGAPDATPPIPQRSFIRAPFERHREEYLAEIKQLWSDMLDGKADANRGLSRLGLRMVRDMQRAIRKSEDIAPNAQATIEKKHSSRPLVDTGQLIRSITHEVVR